MFLEARLPRLDFVRDAGERVNLQSGVFPILENKHILALSLHGRFCGVLLVMITFLLFVVVLGFKCVSFALRTAAVEEQVQFYSPTPIQGHSIGGDDLGL